MKQVKLVLELTINMDHLSGTLDLRESRAFQLLSDLVADAKLYSTVTKADMTTITEQTLL